MTKMIRLLKEVALTVDLPEHKLSRGQVGTIVEILDGGFFEVEFSDNAGRAYAVVPVEAKHLLVLHYQPETVAWRIAASQTHLEPSRARRVSARALKIVLGVLFHGRGPGQRQRLRVLLS
ncbi:MAG: DUF4926 domain-containing protein [Planctomycetes bacterium]|nr:DUF4926 domain-containing protein [Planctomycetota bacterium]